MLQVQAIAASGRSTAMGLAAILLVAAIHVALPGEDRRVVDKNLAANDHDPHAVAFDAKIDLGVPGHHLALGQIDDEAGGSVSSALLFVA